MSAVDCSKEMVVYISVNTDEGKSDNREDERPWNILWNGFEYPKKTSEKYRGSRLLGVHIYT